MKLISCIVAILMLCTAPRLSAAISLAAHTSAASRGSALSLTTGSIDTTGANFIVISVSYFQIIPQTISDNKGNTWTPLRSFGASSSIQLYYSYAPTVGIGHTFTARSSIPSYQAIAIAAFSGIASSPFNVQNGSTPPGVAGTFATGSITPAQNGELIISAISAASAAADTIDSSMTVIDQQTFSITNNFSISLAYRGQFTAAAINPSWTIGTQLAGSTTNGLTVASFKAVPGAGVQIISGGTAAMGTAAISSGSCAPPVTSSAFGVAISDAIIYNNSTDPTRVTGYAPSSSGSLYIWAFPTANNVNFVVCNPSSSSITPGALTLNWQVMR